MRYLTCIVLIPCLTTFARLASASPTSHDQASPIDQPDTSLSLRMRLLYANYSGGEAFLPHGAIPEPDENLSGDGIGADLWTSFGSLDLGITASSVFWLNRDPSYFGGAFLAKSLRSSDWRLSFGAGFGALTLTDSSEPNRTDTKIRPATAITANLDYFPSQHFFFGCQVQSWVGLGPEGDLGISSASLAIGYDLL